MSEKFWAYSAARHVAQTAHVLFVWGGRGPRVGAGVQVAALRCVRLRSVLRSACGGVSAQGQAFAAARALALSQAHALPARGLWQSGCCRRRVGRLAGRPGGRTCCGLRWAVLSLAGGVRCCHLTVRSSGRRSIAFVLPNGGRRRRLPQALASNGQLIANRQR